MVLADRLDEVTKVVDDRFEIDLPLLRSEETRVVHDAHGPARLRDRAELFIIEISPVRVGAADSGVADEQRLSFIVNRDGVEETLSTDMGKIDEDPLRVQKLDEFGAGLRKTRIALSIQW